MNQNKVYAVKRGGVLWCAIDCGEAKQGGTSLGDARFFRKEGRAYRYLEPLYKPPEEVQEWQEIKVRTVYAVDEDGYSFDGWDEMENSLYNMFAIFATQIGKPMTPEEVKALLKLES